MINKTIKIKPSNKMKEVLKVMQELKDLRKENSILKFKNNELKQQLILSGVVKSFCECTDNPMKIEMTVSRCASCCEIVKD